MRMKPKKGNTAVNTKRAIIASLATLLGVIGVIVVSFNQKSPPSWYSDPAAIWPAQLRPLFRLL